MMKCVSCCQGNETFPISSAKIGKYIATLLSFLASWKARIGFPCLHENNDSRCPNVVPLRIKDSRRGKGSSTW